MTIDLLSWTARNVLSAIGFSGFTYCFLRERPPIAKYIYVLLVVFVATSAFSVGMSFISYFQAAAHLWLFSGAIFVFNFVIAAALVIGMGSGRLADRVFAYIAAGIPFLFSFMLTLVLTEIFPLKSAAAAFAVKISVQAVLGVGVGFLCEKAIRAPLLALWDTSKGKKPMLITIPVFICAMTLACFYPTSVFVGERDNLVPCLSVLIAVSGFVYVLCAANARGDEEEKQQSGMELKVMKAVVELWKRDFADMKREQEDMRGFKRDMRKNHMLAAEYIRDGKYEEVEELLNRAATFIEKNVDTTFCKNPAINAAIAANVHRARELSISTTVRVAVPEALGIDDIEISGIFSNLLENAVEACAGAGLGTEPFITLKAQSKNSRLLIRMENSCKQDVRFGADGLPISGKEGGGLGLRIIKYIAERYGGIANYSAEGGVFKTSVVLFATGIRDADDAST